MTNKRAISIIVHAESKVGKSTLASTCPPPLLFLDVEAGHRFLPGRKVFWDPLTQAPPTCENNEWDMCVVNLRSYAHMQQAYAWLDSGQHCFRSVAIDSITELQVRCKEQLEGSGQMTMQRWGELLTHMEQLVRGFRDLTEHPTNPLEAVIVTSMTEFRDNKWRPYVQGKLQVKLPYFFDLIMYLYTEDLPQSDPTQPPTRVRRGLTQAQHNIEAGERVQGRLPMIIDNPRVDTMLDAIFGPLEIPVTTQQPAAPTS